MPVAHSAEGANLVCSWVLSAPKSAEVFVPGFVPRKEKVEFSVAWSVKIAEESKNLFRIPSRIQVGAQCVAYPK